MQMYDRKMLQTFFAFLFSRWQVLQQINNENKYKDLYYPHSKLTCNPSATGETAHFHNNKNHPLSTYFPSVITQRSQVATIDLLKNPLTQRKLTGHLNLNRLRFSRRNQHQVRFRIKFGGREQLSRLFETTINFWGSPPRNDTRCFPAG